jgi:hypothetical protein
MFTKAFYFVAILSVFPLCARSEDQDGLSLGLECISEPFVLEGDIKIRMMLRNSGSKTVLGVTNGLYEDFLFELKSPNGEDLKFNKATQLAIRADRLVGSTREFILKRKESDITTVDLGKLFDISKEGVYSLKVTRKLQLGDGGKDGVINIESKVIKVVIGKTIQARIEKK